MNNNSRLSNSIKNISFGLLAQVIQMVLGFVSRTIFIKYLAVEYLGVNGLFTNILSLLSLAELGITSAIVFSLYKPLANKDEKKLAGLIHFFAKVYTRIALIVAVLGLLVVPFLKQIVENPPSQIKNDLVIIYLLFLFNTVSAYFMQYKLSLFHADQKSYVISKNNTFLFILQNLAQIIVLVLFKNFILYLIAQSVFQLVSNFIISRKVAHHYPFLKEHKNEIIDEESKKQIYSNVKSTGLVKVGGLLVNSTDNLILNYYSGLLMVGLLSNYVLLIGLATGLIVQVFSGLTGSIANINVTENKEKQFSTFNSINFANFWIYGITTIGIIVLLNDFILLWIGTKFILPISIVIILALNFYMVGMQNAVWTFKSTYGFFKQGQYLVILTAVLNLVFSFILGKYFGLFGILVATAIARLITNTWYDPYVVFTLGLKQNPTVYLRKYITYIVILAISLGLIFGCTYFISTSNWLTLVIKFVLCLVIPNVMIYIFCKNTSEFKNLIALLYAVVNKLKSKKI
jgi:O-antigen/teichoic acid export membrane protein